MMIVRTFLLSLVCALALAVATVRADDEQHDPLRDVQVGMQGLMQASQDPALMAQLVQDMQVRRFVSTRAHGVCTFASCPI